MITASELYWIFRCDSIHDMLTASLTVLVIASAIGCIIILAMCFSCSWDDDVRSWFEPKSDSDTSAERKQILTVVKYVACLLGIVCMLAVCKVMLPTTKELVLIKVLPAVANSNFVQEELPSDIRKLYTAAVRSAFDTLTGSQQKYKERR
mgnify:CR=1 FL=1